ncbi:flavodoxin family protein [Clostridiaceae bacterium]|nr:flavodoxin family protein [Clostridiaceae bacterium]RKI17376.1 flavodoxin family protein [bacterium 1XD21-70]
MAKILLVNGSCNLEGCTYTALREIADTLEKEGLEADIFQLGKEPVRDCLGCGACAKLGKCAFEDGQVNTFVELARQADGFVFGTPVYYAHPSGRILSFLDRAFYSGSNAFAFKPGAAIASARRAGTTASLDVLNKYFTINRMPMVSSNYWNMVHGNTPGEVRQDLEGLQIMRGIGQNMAWLVKCIQAGKDAGIGFPQTEGKIRTNFIR